MDAKSREPNPERVLQVSVVWRDVVLDVRQVAPGSTAWLELQGERRQLVEWREAVAVLCLPNARRLDVAEGGASVAVDDLTVVASYAERAALMRREPLESSSVEFMKVLAIALLVFTAAAVSMAWIPHDEEGDDGVGFGRATTMLKELIVTAKPPPKVPTVMDRIHAAQAAAASAPKPVKVDNTPAGDKHARDANKVSAMMASLFGGAPNAVFAAGGLNPNINDALNGLPGGNVAGPPNGMGGSPRGGNGPGIGGNGLGWVGGVGPGGPGPGHGVCRGDGCGLAHHDQGPSKDVRVIGDGLDRDVIQKVIRRHMSEIKFCYEQALNTKHDLSGKISVAWTIDGTGAVSQADVADSSLDDANVEACVLARIRRWRFPEPRGGGVVVVNYPWLFKAAGSDD